MSETGSRQHPDTLEAVCQSVSNLVLAGAGPPRRADPLQHHGTDVPQPVTGPSHATRDSVAGA